MLTISAASSRDADAIAHLLVEIDQFYGQAITEPAEAKLPHINSVLFGNPPLAFALLAWDGTSLVGMAAYSFLWPAARTTKSLYLKELYVRQSHRRTGVGRLLMEQLFKVAKGKDCNRIEWTTDDDNAEARGFYETLGVSPSQSKLFYQVEGQDRFVVADSRQL